MTPHHYGKWIKSGDRWLKHGNLNLLHIFNDGYGTIVADYYEDGNLVANFDLVSEDGLIAISVWNENSLSFVSVADCKIKDLFARLDGVVSNYKKTGNPKPGGINVLKK